MFRIFKLLYSLHSFPLSSVNKYCEFRTLPFANSHCPIELHFFELESIIFEVTFEHNLAFTSKYFLRASTNQISPLSMLGWPHDSILINSTTNSEPFYSTLLLLQLLKFSILENLLYPFRQCNALRFKLDLRDRPNILWTRILIVDADAPLTFESPSNLFPILTATVANHWTICPTSPIPRKLLQEEDQCRLVDPPLKIAKTPPMKKIHLNPKVKKSNRSQLLSRRTTPQLLGRRTTLHNFFFDSSNLSESLAVAVPSFALRE